MSSLGVACGAVADQQLRGVDLTREHGEHVEAGHGFFLDEDGDVFAVDFEARCGHGGDGCRLVRGAFEHGCEAEDLAVVRLVDKDFLAVGVFDGDVHRAGNDDIGANAVLACFVNALAGSKFAELDVRGEDVEFIVVEQREERDVAEFLRVAGHTAECRG